MGNIQTLEGRKAHSDESTCFLINCLRAGYCIHFTPQMLSKWKILFSSYIWGGEDGGKNREGKEGGIKGKRKGKRRRRKSGGKERGKG